MKIPFSEHIPFINRDNGPTTEQQQTTRKRLEQIRTQSDEARQKKLVQAQRATDARAQKTEQNENPQHPAPPAENPPPKKQLTSQDLEEIALLQQDEANIEMFMNDSDSTGSSKADDARDLDRIRRRLQELKGETPKQANELSQEPSGQPKSNTLREQITAYGNQTTPQKPPGPSGSSGNPQG